MSSLEAGFVQFLLKLAAGRDRKPLAVLKRSLAFPPGTYWPAFPYVEPFVGSEEGWPREAHYVVAGLFARDPVQVDGRTLPRSLGEEYRSDARSSLEARFLALLDSDRDQVVDRLRRTVALVARGGLDWARLLADIRRWFHPDRVVQRRWALEFYRSAAPDRAVEEDAP
jgi:CRISPR system Cascade subunit CasB